MNVQESEEPRPSSGRRTNNQARDRASTLPRLNRLNSDTHSSNVRNIFSDLGATLGRLAMGQAQQAASQTNLAGGGGAAATRPNVHNDVRETLGGIRARSTTIRANNGNVFSIVNIGVPSDHPLADTSSQLGTSGLNNI